MLNSEGMWLQIAGENPYDFNYAYNIKYQLERSLKAIDKIYNPTEEINEYSNKCVYYHIYSDQLLDAVSIIEKRFRQNENSDIEKHINIQRISFEFKPEIYPNILICRDIRNAVEHNDEVSIKHIQTINEADGFNAIFDETDESRSKELRESKYLVYLLDLKHDTITASRFIKEERKTYVINLIELKKELLRLSDRTNKIWEYVTSAFLSFF